jgi:flagellar protein FlgJ
MTGIGAVVPGRSGDLAGIARRTKEAEGEALFADLLRKALPRDAAAEDEDRRAAVPAAADREDGAPRTAARSTPSGRPVVDKSGELYEQCEALETFLIKNLLSSMRNTVQKSGLVGEGFAGRIYEDMLYDEYAKVYAKNAGFGFAELAYLELTGQRGKVIAD